MRTGKAHEARGVLGPAGVGQAAGQLHEGVGHIGQALVLPAAMQAAPERGQRLVEAPQLQAGAPQLPRRHDVARGIAFLQRSLFAGGQGSGGLVQPAGAQPAAGAVHQAAVGVAPVAHAFPQLLHLAGQGLGAPVVVVAVDGHQELDAHGHRLGFQVAHLLRQLHGLGQGRVDHRLVGVGEHHDVGMAQQRMGTAARVGGQRQRFLGQGQGLAAEAGQGLAEGQQHAGLAAQVGVGDRRQRGLQRIRHRQRQPGTGVDLPMPAQGRDQRHRLQLGVRAIGRRLQDGGVDLRQFGFDVVDRRMPTRGLLASEGDQPVAQSGTQDRCLRRGRVLDDELAHRLQQDMALAAVGVALRHDQRVVVQLAQPLRRGGGVQPRHRGDAGAGGGRREGGQRLHHRHQRGLQLLPAPGHDVPH